MRNLSEIAKICMKELDAINIPYGKIEKFVVNSRAKRQWGDCTEVSPGTYIISIRKLLLDENTDIIGLKSTIMHELLHSCKGCMSHTGLWKIYADKVNNTYGYNVKRASYASEKGISKEAILKEAKHQYQCTKCGNVVGRQRDNGFEIRYRCTCGGIFKKLF